MKGIMEITVIGKIIVLLWIVKICLSNTSTLKGHIRHHRDVDFLQRKTCSSWNPSVTLINPHKIEVSVQFNDLCSQLTTHARWTFYWNFRIKCNPAIPGQLDMISCNCKYRRCMRTFSHLSLAHNVMYTFTIKPNCSLCAQCSSIFLRKMWRNESIIHVDIHPEHMPPTGPRPKPPFIYREEYSPAAVILAVVSTILVAIILTMLVYVRRGWILKKLRSRGHQHSSQDTLANNTVFQNQTLGENQSTKKKALYLCEGNTIFDRKLLSILKAFDNYFTVDFGNSGVVIDNLTSSYDSVIIVVENWMVQNGDGAAKPIRDTFIMKVLESLGDGGKYSGINKHFILRENNFCLYQELQRKYKLIKSSCYYLRDITEQSDQNFLWNIFDLAVNISHTSTQNESLRSFTEEAISTGLKNENLQKTSEHLDKTSLKQEMATSRKSVLVLFEQDEKCMPLIHALQEFSSYFTVDDINKIMTSPKLSRNRNDWLDSIPKVYNAVIVVLQKWMVADDIIEVDRETPVKDTVTHILELLKNDRFEQKHNLKTYIIQATDEKEDGNILTKLKSKYWLHIECVFNVSVCATEAEKSVSQLTELVFSICGGANPQNHPRKSFITEKITPHFHQK